MNPETTSSDRSSWHLLKVRRFAPFFVTQFLGAFNDNLFKNALVVLLTFQAANWTTLAPELLGNLAAGVFILPFFIFSATAGQLADKYDKAKLARLVKALEMVIMGIAAAGFFLHSLVILLGALFLLGLHSTLFGPTKYAILPQHLHEDELVGGNALVESATFVAILIGTLAGGLLAGLGEHPAWVAMAGLVVAAAGFVASCRIPAAPAPAPDLKVNWNPFSETWRNIGFARHDHTVFMAIIGISWFWLYGAMFLAQFPAYAKNVLGGDETSVTLLLATFTVGIGVGSMLCEKFSGRQIELGLIPFGVIGLAVFGIDIGLASPEVVPANAPLNVAALLQLPSTWRVVFDLLVIGIFGGLFIVPLYVLIQVRAEPHHRARIIAANNILNALFMVVGALGASALLAGGMTIPQLFMLTAICNGVLLIPIYRAAPEHFLRLVVAILIHIGYRVDKPGSDNIPTDGPAVLVFNHVSFIDALVVMAAIRRPIRFVMDHRIYATPGLNVVLRHAHTIPIAPEKEDASVKEAAFAEVRKALRQGELIGLFPEGAITRDGQLNQFRYGVQRIVDETAVPVVPVALRGLWGSFFSRRYGPAMTQWRRIRLFRRVAVIAGAKVDPADVSTDLLWERVAQLRGVEN